MNIQQQYEEWKADPKAQAEYDKWRIEDELKRAKLPDPFTTDPQAFAKAFNQIFGVNHEPNS